jgi:hypothetical protein
MAALRRNYGGKKGDGEARQKQGFLLLVHVVVSSRGIVILTIQFFNCHVSLIRRKNWRKWRLRKWSGSKLQLLLFSQLMTFNLSIENVENRKRS